MGPMSLWLEGAARTYPRLDGDAQADAVIVGGGIAGIATAYFLAKSGMRPMVLEARGVAEAASGRNAGFLLAGVAENFVAASRRYGPQNALRIWKLTRHTQELVKNLVAEYGIECDLRWEGSDQIAGDEEEWKEIEESAHLLSAQGATVSIDAPTKTVTYADDGEIHPVRWVRGLAAAAVRLGARIHEDTTVRSAWAGQVRTDRGTVSTGAIVLCTNAYTSHLVPSRIRPVRGQMLATAPTAPVFARPAYAKRGYQYWRQRMDGRVLVGGWRDTAVEEEVGEEERTTVGIQAHLEAFLRERGIDAPTTHRWAGTMGFSRDALPYVGQHTGPRLFVCGGFTGHGMAFAPASAEIVAALVRGGKHPDADLFDPSR